MATTFRAEDHVFKTLRDITKELDKGSDNKTIIYLIENYSFTKNRVKELEELVKELQQFKSEALELLKLERQVQLCKSRLLECEKVTKH